MHDFSKNTILVVDSDQETRTLLKATLSQLDGVEILESDGLSLGIDIIASMNIKTIISNMKCSDKQSTDFASRVRAAGLSLPIIFVSGDADKDSAIRALKLGAFDFIENPFCGSEILESVSKALKIEGTMLLSRLQKLNVNLAQARILEMVLKGMSNKEIAEIINLSEQGVKYHMGNLLKKFASKNRSDLKVTVSRLVEALPANL